MQAERNQFSRAVFLVAGMAAGALARSLSDTRRTAEIAALKRSLANVQDRLDASEARWEQSITRVDERLDAHEAKLGEVPSTGQIVAAMDELLSKTMQSLNQRLSVQADSIELLKTTVAQTDGLLERVLESLDALRQTPEGHAESNPPPK